MKKETAPLSAIRPPISDRGSNVIAVASGKGGVGKTWFSITLAQALTALGENILLFDGDLGLANLDIQLGLMSEADLSNVLSGKLTLNQAIQTSDEAKFDLIAGRSGSGTLTTIPSSRLQMLSEDLLLMAPGYDRIILDLGAGLDKAVRQFAKTAATCLVICTDEPTSLTDAYAFIKVLTMEKPGIGIRIVVNAANSKREGERTYHTLLKACQNFLKITPPLLGIIRRDTRVRDAIRNQTPLLSRHPTAEAAQDVEAIAANLHKETADQ